MEEHKRNIRETALVDIFPFWEELASTDKELLLNRIVHKEYAAGVTIKQPSEECGGVLLVISGRLRAYFTGEEGREITLYRLSARDLCILTASCTLSNITLQMAIETEVRTSLYQISSATWEDISSRNAAVSRFSMAVITKRFADVMWVLDQMISKNLGQRIASFLVEQSVLSDSDTLYLTHEAIAHNLGTSREVISRLLKYYEADGVISQKRGVITILDRSKLLK